MNPARVKEKTTVMQKEPEFYRNILETIGHTPLVRLNQVVFGHLAANIYAKVEFFNPAGSIKDRVGLAIIENAEKEGRLHSRR